MSFDLVILRGIVEKIIDQQLARAQLMKELSRLFKRRVEFVSGFSSRQKRVLIRDIEVNEVRQVLDATTL